MHCDASLFLHIHFKRITKTTNCKCRKVFVMSNFVAYDLTGTLGVLMNLRPKWRYRIYRVRSCACSWTLWRHIRKSNARWFNFTRLFQPVEDYLHNNKMIVSRVVFPRLLRGNSIFLYAKSFHITWISATDWYLFSLKFTDNRNHWNA